MKQILFLILIIFNCSSVSKESIVKPKPIYESLSNIKITKTCSEMLKNLGQDSVKFNYTEFRISCARSENFNPNYSNGTTRSEIETLIEKKEYEKAFIGIRKFLIHDPADIMAYIYMEEIYFKIGKPDMADFFHFIAVNLIDSIIQSGDGTNQNKAFYMISVKEEYSFINLMGFKNLERYTTTDSNGQSYDVFTLENIKTGKKHLVYFNITESFLMMNRMMNKKKDVLKL